MNVKLSGEEQYLLLCLAWAKEGVEEANAKLVRAKKRAGKRLVALAESPLYSAAIIEDFEEIRG
jgi:hypothetical protein